MPYSILADILVFVHALFVAFVVIGQLVIWLGLWRGWLWVRGFWFRVIHLLAIGVVALEAACDVACPLTVWEEDLRRRAGQTVEAGTFVGRAVHSLIFYEFPPWVFNVFHVGFGMIVLATFVLAPPRWRRLRDLAAGTDCTEPKLAGRLPGGHL